MKPLLFSLLMGWAVGAAAQAPQPGFGRKHKTGLPTPGLAQRLNAGVAPVPQSGVNARVAAGLSNARLNSRPLRLRIVRDTASQLPVYIENRTPIRPGAGKGARINGTASAFAFLNQVKGILKIDRPEEQFTITRTETDALGQTHIRMAQVHQGVPVYGSELIAHLTEGTVTLLNGQYRPLKNTVSTQPRLTVGDAASLALKDVGRESVVRTFGENLLKMKSSEGELCLYPVGREVKLAYRMTIRPNMIERWQYVIDAQTGAVLDKYNHTCGVDGVVKATGKDLNGVSRSFQTLQDGKEYFMIDLSRPMFDEQATIKAKQLVGALVTLDADNTYGDKWKVKNIVSTSNTNWKPTAISAHYNAGLAYEYFLKVHKRNSLNGKGGTITSIINIVNEDGTGMDNAYWNGQYMGYGNGNKLCKPLAGGLDVAGHEMTHGVVENSANLEYKEQSGALNESFADIFGTMLDRDDWMMGEDIVLKSQYPGGAMRNFANPNQAGEGTRGYQPKHMSQFIVTTEDNGGVHRNSGIPNHAYYQFATKIGKEKAEQIYYRALTNYLTRSSKFLDLRLAVIRAAGDLYGATSNEVTAAKQAFDAVGIVETNQQPDDPKDNLPTNNGQDMILLYGVGDEKLYTVPFGSEKFEAKVKVQLKHRPSITDDGKVAYYVSADKRIRAVNLTGTPKEVIVSDEPIWDNVAISKDGTKLAALTAEQDTSIWVYSYDLKKWMRYGLYNPTTAEGVTTGDVVYADSFEWDYSGEYIIYDAYNRLNNLDGEANDYWDVGFIRVWDKAKKTFGKGQIEKLYNGLPEGVSIGNPSFSKNSPDVLTFDYYDATEESYLILAADLKEGKLMDVVINNTLGFPGYSRLDNKLIFNTISEDEIEQVAVIDLEADKISPKSDPEVVYDNAKWAVWYGNGVRLEAQKTAQTITFNEIPDRYAGDGSFTLTATASSKLPVTFQIVSGPATLNGSRVTPQGPGVVTIRATQAGNDEFAAATPVERKFSLLAITGISNEPTWVDGVKTYPNPVVSSLTVEISESERLESLSLTSASGATVLRQSFATPTHRDTLDLSRLSPGMYVLEIRTPKGVTHKKILKQQ
ncbi:M4 family metallopeptidase [Larkinella soli]|uniref:M4 family metallopeptidase n=1 Tax=Larkinella soli TaxID=1770527 RepID=UPI000FFBD4B3|nr:M4 family metallopeptidase [Larkinella soli]